MILPGKTTMQIIENGKKRFWKEEETLKYFHCLKDRIRKAERLKAERGQSWRHGLKEDKAMVLGRAHKYGYEETSDKVVQMESGGARRAKELTLGSF